MATHSSILAWRIPRTEEPGGLQSMGSQRVGHELKRLTLDFHFNLAPHWAVCAYWKPSLLRKELKAASVLPLQLPNFINTTLPPHEQVTAQEIDSYFRQELIYKRNERMGKRVMALLQENEDKICFFAFGAGLGRSGEGIVCRILQG